MSRLDLAGGREVLGTWMPEQLLAGEAPIITDYANVVTGAGVTFSKFEVVALNTTTNTIIKHNPAGSGDETIAVGIISQPIEQNQTTQVGYFAGGFFNHESLVWHASLNTFEKRKAVFRRTPVFIGQLIN